jgi:PIN domain
VVAYLDSSVVLRHVLRGETAISQALVCGRVVSSELLEIECRRVIQRCRMQGEFDDAGLAEATVRLDAVLAGISLLAFSSSVKRRAMGAFPVSVKTLDALHLASALVLAEKLGDETVLLFSHDEGMNRCARVLGFAVPLAG